MKRAAKKRKAVFLDRDGVINREVHYLRDVRQFRLLPGASRAIKTINALGYAAIVITNQGVIAHGLLTERKLDRIHAAMIRRLARGGARLDGIYYCPHHPDAKLKKYRILCRCRKPKVGMITRAVKQQGISLQESFIVGDRTEDILAGMRVGLTAIAVETGYGGKDGRYAVRPDFVAKDLPEAVRIIKRHAR